MAVHPYYSSCSGYILFFNLIQRWPLCMEIVTKGFTKWELTFLDSISIMERDTFLGFLINTETLPSHLKTRPPINILDVGNMQTPHRLDHKLQVAACNERMASLIGKFCNEWEWKPGMRNTNKHSSSSSFQTPIYHYLEMCVWVSGGVSTYYPNS